MKIFRRARRAIVVPLAAAAVLLGSQAAAIASSPTPSSVAAHAVLHGSAAPHLPAGAAHLGAVPATQEIHLDVTLKVRDQSALTAYLDGLANRKSPYFHHFLAKGQFGPLFGPTLAQVEAVDSALTAAGLSPGTVTSDRLTIPVTATAAQVDHAFDLSLVDYRLPGGRVAFASSAAPAIAASVAPIVAGVLGLNDLYQAQPVSLEQASADQAQRLSLAHLPRTRASTGSTTTARPAVTGPQPCAAASNTGITIDQFASYYGMSPLYGLGDLGQGQKIALLELEPNLPADVTAYESCYGISTPVNYVEVDGGPGSAPTSSETALDIDVTAGLAPGATIDVYQAPNDGTGIPDAISQFVTADTESTMSISWALCEELSDSAEVDADENAAAAADAQGQTILAAAGDTGSSGCLRSDAADADLSISVPADTPYIDSVGGTGFDSSGNEVVWNESAIQAGAGGGGLSTVWCMPDYQYQPSIPGIFNGETATYSACADTVDTPGYARETPDISANADPETGYVVYYDGTWQVWGGTSGASPLLAALAALTDASPYCSAYGSGAAGVFPQALYFMAAADAASIYSGAYPQVLRDITSGDNDYTPSGYAGGLYPATMGYDMASGLGAPIVFGVSPANYYSTYYPGYTALMCEVTATKLTSHGIASISPGSGTAGQAATVTVNGSGFLPIASADLIDEYSGSRLLATLTPSCTTTACRVTLPAESAGTVTLRVSVEDNPFTSASVASQFTYRAAPPHVTSISPAHGTKNGGTRVTIKGSGFAGVKSVTFGARAGTRVSVSGTGTITVTAPAGTEGATVKVVVSAAGGTSNAAAYRYADTPHITSVSPSRGTHGGGTKVTVKGSGFVGVRSVTFGGRAGTHVSVSGTGTLTVITPKGTKGARVKVVIAAVGGTSNTVLYLYT
jgi:subtilase family serine protease